MSNESAFGQLLSAIPVQTECMVFIKSCAESVSNEVTSNDEIRDIVCQYFVDHKERANALDIQCRELDVVKNRVIEGENLFDSMISSMNKLVENKKEPAKEGLMQTYANMADQHSNANDPIEEVLSVISLFPVMVHFLNQITES